MYCCRVFSLLAYQCWVCWGGKVPVLGGRDLGSVKIAVLVGTCPRWPFCLQFSWQSPERCGPCCATAHLRSCLPGKGFGPGVGMPQLAVKYHLHLMPPCRKVDSCYQSSFLFPVVFYGVSAIYSSSVDVEMLLWQWGKSVACREVRMCCLWSPPPGFCSHLLLLCQQGWAGDRVLFKPC